MGKPNFKFVCKAYEGQWRIWNRKRAKWWGNPFSDFPTALLAELNGEKRSEKIVELTRNSK